MTDITRIYPRAAADSVRLTPKFGKRLHDILVDKGWTQSDLARQAGIERNNVSRYIRGLQLPTLLTLQSIARALGMKPEEFHAEYVEEAAQAEEPMFLMKTSPSDPDVAWLVINQSVPLEIAFQIGDLLRKAAEKK